LIVVALTSVNRSVIFRFSVDPLEVVAGVLSLKFAVSTTTCCPPVTARDAEPARTFAGGSGRPSSGTIRTSEPELRDDRRVSRRLHDLDLGGDAASLPVVFTGSGLPPRTSGEPAALPVMHRV